MYLDNGKSKHNRESLENVLVKNKKKKALASWIHQIITAPNNHDSRKFPHFVTRPRLTKCSYNIKGERTASVQTNKKNRDFFSSIIL